MGMGVVVVVVGVVMVEVGGARGGTIANVVEGGACEYVRSWLILHMKLKCQV
jgi:hypothetical protein